MWIKVSKLHELNELGEVRNIRSKRVLKAYMCGKYLGLRFELNGTKHYIHRLVAMYFLPFPTDPACIVDHIDRDKMNNTAHNLRWVLPKENYENRNIERTNRSQKLDKHHHINKQGLKYAVNIVRKGVLYSVVFETLHLAIKNRDEMINALQTGTLG